MIELLSDSAVRLDEVGPLPGSPSAPCAPVAVGVRFTPDGLTRLLHGGDDGLEQIRALLVQRDQASLLELVYWGFFHAGEAHRLFRLVDWALPGIATDPEIGRRPLMTLPARSL